MKNYNYKKVAKNVIAIEIAALKKLNKSFNTPFSKTIDLIAKCRGKIILAGVGKSGLISRKISATLSSVGTPSFYLHPVEAAHGDLGQITNRDILLIFSYSGETEELKNIIQYANRFGIPLIGVASKKNSLLLKASDIRIVLPEVKEAGEGNLIPTSSTAMQLAFGDALAVTLMNKKKFNKFNFKQLHPAGNLGKMLTTVEDLMITGNKIPLINEQKKMSEAINYMSKKKLGCLIVLNRKKFVSGFVSDGDIRRQSKKNIICLKVKDIMTKNPIYINKKTLAVKALKIMNSKKITSLIVVTNKTERKKIKAVGIIHIHKIIGAGIK
jgi:arabinose-5-phosphate isomerase